MPRQTPLSIWVSPKVDALAKAARHLEHVEKLLPKELRREMAGQLKAMRDTILEEMAREAGTKSYAEFLDKVKQIQSGKLPMLALYP